MSGANIIRRESEQAAKAIGQGTGPVDLGVQGLGNLSWADNKPIYTADPATQALGGAYRGLLGQLSGTLPGMAQQAAQFAGRAQGASGSLFDQLNQFDPIAAAQERFGNLQQVIAPQRAAQQDQLDLRLLQQGRLGGRAGNELTAALAGEQQRQDVSLADQLYGQAEQSQRNMLADALAAGGAANTAYGGLFGQLGQAGQGMQTAYAQPFSQLLNMSTGIGNNLLQQQLARSQGINAYNTAIAGSSGASKGMFGQMAPGLLQGGLMAAGTIFGGPMGAAAAGALGGMGGNTMTPSAGQAAMFGGSPYGQGSFWNTMGS